MKKINASFRDPAGFVYEQEGVLFRKINPAGFANYDFFLQSGLYDCLIKKALMVPHEEISRNAQEIIIKPEKIPILSYPYEWCFSQYQDAALLTLQIQKIAIDFGMSLKDASAFNLQFYQGKPIFIDTLSFECKKTGPWLAYQQFCRHFLSVLALMSYVDPGLQKIMAIYLDGPPLELVSTLLPWKTRMNLGLAMHIHLHAKYQKKYAHAVKTTKKNLSSFQLKALVDSLESSIKKLRLRHQDSEWASYCAATHYDAQGLAHKKRLISTCLEKIHPKTLLDLGSHDGSFTRLASQKSISCIACDSDPIAVEKNYTTSKELQDKYMLPLVEDLANPSASIGWQHHERNSFQSRMQTDCAMALALIHHLAISNNLPLGNIADFFATLAPHLLIEFIPKTDPMVKKLLSTRTDIFTNYTVEGFEKAFSEKFNIMEKEKIINSERIFYWLHRLG